MPSGPTCLPINPSSLSRRQLLKLSAGALLAAGGGVFWPGRSRAAEPATSPLRFVVINDLHYAGDPSTPFFEALFKKINSLDGLAFVLIVGDLVDGGTPAQC